jgi:hypothetical protein
MVCAKKIESGRIPVRGRNGHFCAKKRFWEPLMFAFEKRKLDWSKTSLFKLEAWIKVSNLSRFERTINNFNRVHVSFDHDGTFQKIRPIIQ